MVAQVILALALGFGQGADHDKPRKEAHDGPLPHPDDPVLQAEHLAMLDLVPRSDATHMAVHDGTWSDPASWKDRQVPAAGAKVLIPKNRTITVADIEKAPVQTVRVDGTLRFEPTKDTALSVDTLVVTPTGHLIMGTADQPIAADKRARLIFTGRGAIDSEWDPHLLSRGLISHGTTTMHGARTTSFLALARPARRGHDRLILSQKPVNWKKGDRLILVGTHTNRNQDEELTILAVAGTEVKVRPLAYDHVAPAEGLAVHVANVSRNVILESEKPSPVNSRGHVMFMHSPHATIENVGFYNLGRSDKIKPVNDPKVDHRERLVAGSGLNSRGRYAVHFHRTGAARENPAVVRGSAVVNSPGWGFVNHSSHVVFEDNVAFNVAGAAFVTEAGDEIGSFRRNLAIRSTGSGEDPDGRRKLQDFGHGGDGFWFQGGGVIVEDNVAAGHSDAGFSFYTRPLIDPDTGMSTVFLADNLRDRSLARGQPIVEVGNVPVPLFKGNVAYACRDGIDVRNHLRSAAAAAHTVIDNFTAWNIRRYGASVLYSNKTAIQNSWLVGSLDHPGASDVGVKTATEPDYALEFVNLRVEGWNNGYDLWPWGTQNIKGGFLNNVRNVTVHLDANRPQGQNITIDGTRFGTLSPSQLGGKTQYNVFMNGSFADLQSGKLPYVFAPQRITLNAGPYVKKQVYFGEQAADYVPFKAGRTPDSVPPKLVGKTNKQLMTEYGLAVAGVVAPADATPQAGFHGLIGSQATYPPNLLMENGRQRPRYSNRAKAGGVE